MTRWIKLRAAAWTLLTTGAFVLAFGSGSCADPEPIAERERVGEVQLAGSTGVCDSNPPVSTQACIDAVQAAAGIVNDVFTDSNGLTADQLPVFGQLFNNWPGCTTANHAGCAGQSNPPYDCPGQYACLPNTPNTFANIANQVNALDRLWGHPCRLSDHTLIGNCPNWDSCVANGAVGSYLPWEGLVFDLGGPSNKVAIFAQNDHGPQPCESLEYTVYLTDNPFSLELIVDPAATGVDPDKWNRAVLSQVFTKGFVEIRAPDPAGRPECGDTSQYSVEEDSFAQVFALPCGITFRYAAVIAGNDGLDFAECAFDSSEAELDAVAGLTEAGAGVCPDADDDNYVDCACVGAPAICDCVDIDPAINPGAPEPCDSVDVNCDGNPGQCDSNLVCYQSVCVPTCADENASCPEGSECQQVAEGTICVPVDCSVSGCPDGSVCVDEQCVPACTDVVCPGAQICQDGRCIDPCQDITCPPGLVCQGAECIPPCACYDGDAGCVDLPGFVCDKGNTDVCVPAACEGVTCVGTQTCDPQTGLCVDFCNPNVQCPLGQKCVDPDGCVPTCEGVVCDEGWTCNPDSGDCEDNRCEGVTCFPPFVCVTGECVDGSGSTGVGGGNAGSGGSGGSGASTTRPPLEDDSGCSCRVGSKPTGDRAAFLVLALGAALLRRRRRT